MLRNYSTCILYVFFFISSISLCLAGPSTFFPSDSGVVQLTESNWHETIQNPSQNIFVMFYSPKSGKCKEVRDDWIKLVKQLNGMIAVGAVDCLSEESLCESEEVFVGETIPVIKLYSGPTAAKRYGGPPQIKTLMTFALHSLPNEIIPLTNKNINDRSLSKARVILFTDKSDTPNMYKALGQRLNGQIIFGEVKKKEKQLIKKYNIENFPTVIVEPANGHEIVKYQADLTFPALLEWLQQYATTSATSSSTTTGDNAEFAGNDLSNLPVPQLTDQSCLDLYCIHGKASLCAIVVMSASSPDLQPTLTKFAQISTSRADPVYQHVWLDSDKHADFILKGFGLYPADYPQLVVLSGKKDRYVNFLGAFTNDDISDWMRRVTAGKVKTGPIGSTDGKLTPLDDGDTINACQPDQPIPASTGSPKHAGERYLMALTHSTFPTVVLDTPAAWMIFFIKSSDISSTLPTALSLANITRNIIRVAMVNIDLESQLATQYNITITPSLRYFHAIKPKTSQNFLHYAGELNEKDLHTLSRTLLNDQYVRKVRGEEGLNQFMLMDPIDVSRILLFSKHSTVPPLFASLSIDYHDILIFGLVSSTDNALMQKFSQTKVPGLVAVGTIDTDELAPDGRKQLQLVAGGYQQELTWEGLKGWLELVLKEGVLHEGMPSEIRDKYQIGFKRQQERREKLEEEKKKKAAKAQQKAATEAATTPTAKTSEDASKVSADVGSCDTADADDGGMCTASS